VYRVTVACEGIAPDTWPDAVSDLKTEFDMRPHHQIVSVAWSGDVLVLVADNDYDKDGESLADEFSDTVAACAPGTPGYRVRILSAVSVGDNAA
jgi:hypothetical protein